MKIKKQPLGKIVITRPQFNLFIILFFIILLAGCNNSNPSTSTNEFQPTQTAYITDSAFLLNTQVSITIYDKQDEEIIAKCFDLIERYEKIYSRTDSTSELYSLNQYTAHQKQPFTLSKELSDILNYGLYYSKLSEGAFDITIAPITSLWDFHALAPILPQEQDIANALTYVDYKKVNLEGNQVTFTKDGVNIDLGGIAKGYIADRVKELLLSEGVKSAMINLGGNVLCVGKKPDGSPFKVGIQKPFADRNETIEIMEISDLSVVSSGIYERFFNLDGKLYHHILNPKTGYPYDNELISVTIISKNSVDGDGLSTSCFALGLEAGLDLIDRLPDTYAVFITSDYEIHYSKNFSTAITLLE